MQESSTTTTTTNTAAQLNPYGDEMSKKVNALGTLLLNLEALRVIGCERTGKPEHWRYTFRPDAEWQQTCRDRYLEIKGKRGGSL